MRVIQFCKTAGFIGVFSCGLFSATLLAEPKFPVEAKAEVEDASITIGDIVTFKITIRLAKNMELLNGIPQPSALGMEIKDLNTWQDRDGDEIVFGRSWALKSFQLGRYLVEPVEIAYRVGDGEVLVAKTNAVYITLESVLKEGEKRTDIRDVKGVVSLTSQVVKYLLYIGIPIFIIALLVLYMLFFRKKEILSASSKQVLSPHQEALQKLRELFDSSLIRDGKVRIYYFTFSEILKVYIEKQFGVQVIEATTSEIKRILKKVSASEESKSKLIEVLESADYAKFAKWVPPAEDILALNKKAESVVTELRQGVVNAEKEGSVNGIS